MRGRIATGGDVAARGAGTSERGGIESAAAKHVARYAEGDCDGCAEESDAGRAIDSVHVPAAMSGAEHERAGDRGTSGTDLEQYAASDGLAIPEGIRLLQ